LLTDPQLAALGIGHGFGLRGSTPPAGLLRPRQVHGCTIATAAECRRDPPPEADGVLSREPGVAVAIVTADCVPVLLTSESGDAVAAVHAGWRGLARGVVAQGVDALRRNSGAERILAAIGPHIGACCYEVDTPVLEALSASLGRLDAALRPSRARHAYLDLGALVAAALEARGVARADIGRLPDVCTGCDAERFHSYRRDGPKSGRLVHFIAARSSRPTPQPPVQA